MKKKLILGSALGIIMCSSLITGATMALFTSESNVNIAVTTGKVDVVATVDTDSVQTKQLNTEYADGVNNTYAGGVTVSEDGEVTLDKFIPGDGVKFNITIENNSTVDVKYQTVVSMIEGIDLFDGLEITINNELFDGMTSHSSWNSIAVGATDTVIVPVVIELPDTATNEYQGKTCKISFAVNAVQGNADTTNNVVVEATDDPEANGIALRSLLEEVSADTNITLLSGTYKLDVPIVIPSGVNLYGVQAGVPASEWVNEQTEKTIIEAPEGTDRVIKIEQNDGETVSDITIDGIMIEGGGKDVKGIYVKKTAGEAMNNIVIRNNALVNIKNDAIDVSNTSGAIIENNYVSTVFDNGIRYGNYKNPEGVTSYIRNNFIENVGVDYDGGTVNGAIMITEGSGDVVVSRNTINNVSSAGQAADKVDMGESAIVVEDVYEGGVITIENNTLKSVEQGIAVYKFSAVKDGDTVIIRNNIIEGASTFSIATSTLNYINTGIIAVVEVQDNTFEGNEPTKGNMYIETTNRYGESTSGWKVVGDYNASA